MSFHVGETIGDYSVTAILGAGSMGCVYRVRHSLTKRTEAMKVLSAELASETQIKRFQREMRALAKLNHPNIAALYHAAYSKNQLILFMEYVEGQTLESLFAAGRLPLDQGVRLIQHVLSALEYAHRQGVVHRDVTPANVIVTAQGQVKLTDFGLSKSFGDSLLTNCGEILGSLPYLAPEQLKGTTQPDRRSDLYSAGAILYEHLTGQKPFGAKRRLAPVLTDSEGEPAPPSQLQAGLNRKWDEILHRALERDPAHRYQSADEFLDAIARLERNTTADLPLPRIRTLGFGVAIFAGLLLALIVSPVFGWFHPAARLSFPLERLHISPPAFATALPPQPAPRAHRPAPKTLAKRVTPPPAAPALAATDALATADPPPVRNAINPVAAVDSRPVQPEPEPVQAEPAQAEPVQSGAAAAKRGFWSKLNVFRNHHTDKDAKQ